MEVAIAVLTASPVAWAGTTLITDAETRLQDAPVPDGHLGGYARRPQVTLIEPRDGTEPQAPFRFVIRFKAFGSATISPKDVKVIYHKVGGVDITHRLKDRLTGDGIDIPDAEVPPGQHVIRIEIKDSEGTASSTYHRLKVKKP